MKKRMKKLGCLLLAFTMSCQTVALASELPSDQAAGKNEAAESVNEVTETSGEPEIPEDQQVSGTKNAGSEEADVLPPQMGWSSWNFFKQNINEEKMTAVGQALVDSGLNEHGYTYLNLDDCWQSSMRDENGRMQFDLTSFPSGPDFIKNMNALGLKVGVYSSCGDYTCEDLTASYNNEELDARTFAEWGVEYLKYDYCHVVDLSVDSGWENYTKAPDVDYITVAKANTPEGPRYEAEQAILEGNASKQASGNIGYVTGLNGGGGSITFDHIEVAEAGRYVLTVGFYKTYSLGKYVEAVVNDSKTYASVIAPSSGWNNTGRLQMYVDLNEGINKIKIHNPIKGQKEDSIRRYSKMGNALKAATSEVAAENGTKEKPVFYSVCEHGRTQPWTWAQDFASSWRVSGDINANWNTIISKYDIAANLWEYQKPGTYNDPDMLEVGNGSLSKDENKSHFTLWCMLSAPLILGNDVRSFVKEDGSIDQNACNGAYDIVTNDALIEVNQAKPLLQCKRISQENNVDILVKPLANQEVAVCFFNRGSSPVTASYDLSNLALDDSRVELPEAMAYVATNLWDENLEAKVITPNLESGNIPGHGVSVFRIKAAQSGDTDKLAGVKFHTEKMVNTQESFTVSAEVENLGTVTMNDLEAAIELPEGFTAEPVGDLSKALASGEKTTMVWNVKAPESEMEDKIIMEMSYKYADETEPRIKHMESNVSVKTAPADMLVLGDMEWMSAKDGWKNQPARNKSISGNKITIQGTGYDSGVGTNSPSEVKIYLGGRDYHFTAVAGIDDEAIDDYNKTGASYQPPQVTFELWADGVRIYDSGIINMDKPKTDIDLVIRNCRELVLRVTEGGNTNSYDHADWADARFQSVESSETHSITIEQTENGTITTNPVDSVIDGGNIEITFTPDPGYLVSQPTVNGEIVELTGGKYILKNVTSDVTISSGFVAESDSETNIALEAVASSPAATSVNSGPEKANDGDTDTSKNGFSILENQDDANKYLQYDWLEGKDITSLKLSTSYAQRRGAQECKILISSDGTNFEELAVWSDIVWETDENIIETKVYNLSDEEKKKAANVKAMRFQIVKAKYAWDSTVIMELEVMGKTSAQQTISHQVEYSQPSSGGSIEVSSEGADVESGSHIEEGKSVTLSFIPLRGYSLKAAYVNDVEVSVSADGSYKIESLDQDISVRGEFIENTINGKVDMSAVLDSPEGVKVTLYGTFGEKEAETTTDKEGSYLFSRIPFGEYTVGIEETERYTAEKVTVVLNSVQASAENILPVLKPADKTALIKLIADMKKTDLSQYTQESADGFRRVLSEAEILAGKTLTVDQQTDITNMITKLNQAKGSLVTKPADKAALLALIAAMKKIDLSQYTQASADVFRAALSEAETLAGKNLTVEQAADITNVMAKLNQAKNALVKKPEEQPVTKPITAPAVKAKSTGYKTVELTWKKLDNVSGYEVYRRYNKKTWSRLKDVSQKTSYRDTKAVTGRKYQYAVKAYRIVNGKKIYGPMSKTLTKKAMPSQPKVTAKPYKKAANKITWKKVAGSQKYMIYRKTTSKKAKWERVATVKSNVRTYVDRKAKKGKKYYYAVRSYRKSAGLSCYSSYGSSKRVTTRK